MSQVKVSLDLPPCPLRLRPASRVGQEDVWCQTRRRWVRLTPEEWVRQHFIAYLVGHLGYPAGRLGVEVPIRVGLTTRRCDTVVFDEYSRPQMIVEYKAPSVVITQRTVDQILRYDIALHAPYLVVSNGLNHYCFRLDHTLGCYEALASVPPYAEL